jgi:hypothetical protein
MQPTEVGSNATAAASARDVGWWQGKQRGVAPDLTDQGMSAPQRHPDQGCTHRPGARIDQASSFLLTLLIAYATTAQQWLRTLLRGPTSPR